MMENLFNLAPLARRTCRCLFLKPSAHRKYNYFKSDNCKCNDKDEDNNNNNNNKGNNDINTYNSNKTTDISVKDKTA